MSEVVPIRFGTRLVFSDRWAGRVIGFEVDERWEILNILVTNGLLRRTTVKLPLDKATWTAERIAFPEATSTQAFNREVPPVAAPARPVTSQTPVSLPDTRISGALVDSESRRAAELIVTRGGHDYRVPIGQTAFSGKELLITVSGDALGRYRDDASIEDAVRRAIGGNGAVTQGEKATIDVSVRSGAVLISGNVHTQQTLETLRAMAGRAPGVSGVSVEAVDDVSLELEIAGAFYRSGVSRSARVYPRSTLGAVTIFGYADSAAAAAEAIRTAGRAPGVRSVRDRIQTHQTIAA